MPMPISSQSARRRAPIPTSMPSRPTPGRRRTVAWRTATGVGGRQEGPMSGQDRRANARRSGRPPAPIDQLTDLHDRGPHSTTCHHACGARQCDDRTCGGVMGHGPMQQSSDLPRYGGCPDLGSPAHGRSVDLSCCNSNPFQQNACAAGKEGGKNKASEALIAAAPALPASRLILLLCSCKNKQNCCSI